MTKFAAFSLLALAISSAAAAPSPRRWNNERPQLTQISHSESSLVDASDLTAVVDILKREPEPTWRHNDYDRRPDVTQISSSKSSLIDLSDLTAVVDVLDKREPHYRQQAPDVTQVSSSKSTLVDASDLDLLVDILSQNNYFVSKRSDEEILERRGNDNSPFWARNTKDERCMCVKRTTCGGNGGNGGNYNPPHVYKPTPQQPSKDHDHGNDWTPKPKPPHVYQPNPNPSHHSCPTGWSSYSKSSLVDLSGADIVLSILSGNQATEEKTVKAQDATCQDGKKCCWKRGPNTCPSGWSSYSKSTLVDLSDANIVLSILSGNNPTNERTLKAKDANCEAGQNCCWKRSESCPTGWSSYSESSLVDLSGLDVVLSVLSGNKATEQRTVQAKDARCANGKQCCWQRANKAASCPSGWSSYSKSTLIDLSDITIDLSILSDNGKVTDSRKVKAKDASCGAGQRCCYQKSESKSSLIDASGLDLGLDILSNNKDNGKGGLLGGNVIPGLLR